jgi:predicted ribosomally synthesized peptide with nif11-like leader
MSEEQLKAFWEAVQADAGLQEKLSAANDADADAVVAIAKAAGFEISVEEVAKAQAELSDAELSDEQLSGVAGGFSFSFMPPPACR